VKYELITVKKILGSYKVKVLEKQENGQVILTVLGKNDIWKIHGRPEEPSPALLKVLKSAQFQFEGTGVELPGGGVLSTKQDPHLPEPYSQEDIDRRLEMMADGKLPTPEQAYREHILSFQTLPEDAQEQKKEEAQEKKEIVKTNKTLQERIAELKGGG